MDSIEEKKSRLLKFAKRIYNFVGRISASDYVIRNDGGLYAKFGMYFKKNKDDTPEWLNCYLYGTLADKFPDECAKGAKVYIQGYFVVSEKEEQKFLNFIVTNYRLLEHPTPKQEEANV